MSYYARYNSYGINANGGDFYRFSAKKERDEWVNKLWLNNNNNVVAEVCKRKDVEEWLGKHFVADSYQMSTREYKESEFAEYGAELLKKDENWF